MIISVVKMKEKHQHSRGMAVTPPQLLYSIANALTFTSETAIWNTNTGTPLVVYVVALRPVIKEGRIERGETEFMVPQNCLRPSCGPHCY